MRSGIGYVYLTAPYIPAQTAVLHWRTALARLLSASTLPRTRELELISEARVGGPMRSRVPVESKVGPAAQRAVSPSDEVLPHPRTPSIEVEQFTATCPTHPYRCATASNVTVSLPRPISPLPSSAIDRSEDLSDGDSCSTVTAIGPAQHMPPTPTTAVHMPLRIRTQGLSRAPQSDEFHHDDGIDVVDALQYHPEYVAQLMRVHGSGEGEDIQRLSAWSDE